MIENVILMNLDKFKIGFWFNQTFDVPMLQMYH